GTLANAILIGIFADFWLAILPEPSAYWQQMAMFLIGVVIVAVATGLYISSRLGSGPRDGLMQGVSNRLDKPFWLVRSAFEGTVLTAGWLMGGQVREGTLIFALTIGYLVQRSMKFFKIEKGH
ncbi:MAG: YczE/YyaS/YitT family protein, partial [Actinomycetota bacterium]